MQIIELPQDRRFSIECSAQELVVLKQMAEWTERNAGLPHPSNYQKVYYSDAQLLILEKLHSVIEKALFG
jgi:hypothetical protein